MSYWYVSCESTIYHTRRDCPSLKRPDLYWPVHRSETIPNVYMPLMGGNVHPVLERVNRPRTLCKRCAKAGAS